MAFLGLRGTGDWGTDERPKNFREMILWRHPNGSAPLTALMSKMGSESVDDPEFNWWEEEQNAIRVTGDATGASATSTTLGLVSGGNLLVPGDVLMVEKTETTTYDNELVLVSSITSDTSIVIKRGQAGSSGANTGASPNLTKIGNVFAEGTNSPDVSNTNPTKLYNYAQIFKTAYELTETAKVTRTRTGDPLKNDKKRRMFQHSVGQEFAWLWGQKHEDTGANGKPRRFTGGLRQFINTNVTVFTVDPTEDTFLDAIYPVFDYETEGSGGGNERLILAGNVALNQLNRIARDSSSSRINFDGTVKTYGMELQRWILPQGTVYVRTHPLLNTHGRFSASMFVINPASIKFRPLRDTRSQDNIQANDADTHKGQWLTEAGIEVQHEKTMAYIGDFKNFP
jgi:hypothetical protein